MKYLNANNEFDGMSWITDVQKYEKNIKGLKCKTKVKLKGICNNEAIFDVKLVNVPSKYAKAMTSLTKDVSQGAFQWILISFTHSVAKEDVTKETERISQTVITLSEGLINTLLANGLREFKNAVRDRVNLMIAQYELSKLTFVDGKWKRWNGDVWDGSVWINKNGETYSDDTAVYLSRIVKVL